MNIPKTFEEFEKSKLADKVKDDWEKMDEIKLAYENKVSQAIPDMMKVSDDWEKMNEIRWAYEDGVPQAIPEMMKVKDDWEKMNEIRLKYEKNN